MAIALPLLFPDGRPPSRQLALGRWLGAGGVLVGMVGDGPRARATWRREPPVANPFGIDGAGSCCRQPSRSAFVATAVATVGAGAALIVRLRRSRGVERQQLKWFAYVGA